MQDDKPVRSFPLDKTKLAVLVVVMLAVFGVPCCEGDGPPAAGGGGHAAPTMGGGGMHRSSFGGGDLYVGSDGSGNVYYLDSNRSSYSSGR